MRGNVVKTYFFLTFALRKQVPLSLLTLSSLETTNPKCGSSSVGRALASQAKGRGFEPRLPLTLFAQGTFAILPSPLRDELLKLKQDDPIYSRHFIDCPPADCH